MNIHQYLLPASLAATVHVALLWLMPAESYVRLIEVPLVTVKPPIPDPVPEPPDDTVDRPASAEPVQPLAGKPAPPEPEDNVPTRLPEDILTIAVDHRPRPFDTRLTIIPTTIGPEGVPGGVDVARTAIFPPGLLDRIPRAKVQLPPDYPVAMRHTGTSGSVVVEFDVNTEGRVIRAEALSCTDREFAESALRAVRQWRFEPGRRHGRAVPFRMTVPIEFGLEAD